MNLPPDVVEQILALPGVTVNGLPVQQPKPKAKRPSRQLAEGFVLVDQGVLRAIVPVACTTEVNCRNWRNRSRRSDAAWKAVSKTFGPRLDALSPFSAAYHSGKALRIVLTRLGGRKADASNLPTATKGLEDALAFMLGADDGDARWRAEFRQRPGGEIGVLVEIEVIA